MQEVAVASLAAVKDCYSKQDEEEVVVVEEEANYQERHPLDLDYIEGTEGLIDGYRTALGA